MDLHRLQEIYDELKQAQRVNERNILSPYELLIQQMLGDSSADFCLEIGGLAMKTARQKLASEKTKQGKGNNGQ